MNRLLVAITAFVLCMNLKSQTISYQEYSSCLYINDDFPRNLSDLLNKKGFVLVNQESTSEETSYNYTLKQYDKLYYDVLISKISGMHQIVLTFNGNSKTKEFDSFVMKIKESMILQPKVLGTIYNADTYKDNSGFYYIVESFSDKKIYMISILNYNAMYELYLKGK